MLAGRERLVLITAPAGYGKTALLRNFAARSAASVAWLTLSEWDRDPDMFAERLVATLTPFLDYSLPSPAALRPGKQRIRAAI